MSSFVRLTVVLAIAFCFRTEVSAQSPASPMHLVEVGVPDSLYSAILGEQRQIWIHLPNGGNLQEGHRYPVIYLLDGGALLGGLAAVQEFYNFFRMPEMIVVGISNRNDRMRDLTTSHVSTRQGFTVAASGGAETFTRFIAEELIPYIDTAYPTSNYRTLIGHSYAGLFTINTLINHRDLFTNYIAMDPSLEWDDQKLMKEAANAFSNEDFSGKGLFVSMANELKRFSVTASIDDVMYDSTELSLNVRSILEFVYTAEAKKSNGLHFSWDYYEKDLHGSIPLISMRDGLIFLFDWWELKNPSLYNDPSTPTEDLVTMIRERSQVLTRNMGYPMAMEEELLSMLGYMALDMDQPEKAHTVFNLGLEFYPESAASHEAMADYYLTRSDSSNALIHARHAFEISGSEAHKALVESLRNAK